MDHGDELNELRQAVEQMRRELGRIEGRLNVLEQGTPPSLRQRHEERTAPAGPPPLPGGARPPIPPPMVEAPQPAARAKDRPVFMPPERKKEPSALARFVSRIGPPKDMSWEMAIGAYWAPRAGILILAVGAVFLATLAVQYFRDAWWLPHARLILGYAVAAGLLYAGRRLESAMAPFARLLAGGGFGLLYFMTYAAHFIEATQVIPYPEPTLLLLGGLVIACAVVTQRRKSWLLAMGVTAIGHLTVTISALTLDDPGVATASGLMALSALSAWFLLKNGWFWVAALGLAFSWANTLLVFAQSPSSTAIAAFVGAQLIIAVLFALFAMSEFAAPDAMRRRTVALRWRSAYASFNTAAAVFLALATMLNFEFTEDATHWLFFFASAVMAVLGVAYWQQRARDPLAHVYFTKGMTLFTIGLADSLGGHTLTMAIALEALALTIVANRTGLLSPRLLGVAAAIIAFFHGVDPSFDSDAGGGFSAAAAVLALWGAALVYPLGGWRQTLRKGPPSLLTLLDLRRPEGEEPAKPPLLLPSLEALAGAVLALGYSMALFDMPAAAYSMAAAAIIAGSAAFAMGAAPLAYASGLVALGAAVLWFDASMANGAALIGGGLTLAATGIAVERLSARPTMTGSAIVGGAGLFAAWVCLFGIIREHFPEAGAYPSIAVITVALGVYGALLRSPAAAAVAAWSALAGTLWVLGSSYGETLAPLAIVLGYGVHLVLWIAVERLADAQKERLVSEVTWLQEQHVVWTRAWCTGVAAVLLVAFGERLPVLSDFYLTIAWTASAAVLLGLGFAWRTASYRYAALAVFALALVRVVFVDATLLEGVYRILAYMVLGAVLLGVAYLYIRAQERLKGAAGNADNPLE